MHFLENGLLSGEKVKYSERNMTNRTSRLSIGVCVCGGVFSGGESRKNVAV